MARWYPRRGRPEWHEICDLRILLADMTLLEATTEDCDGDREYWSVRENRVLVARGECPSDGSARLAAERVVCYGATAEQRAAARGEKT